MPTPKCCTTEIYGHYGIAGFGGLEVYVVLIFEQCRERAVGLDRVVADKGVAIHAHSRHTRSTTTADIGLKLIEFVRLDDKAVRWFQLFGLLGHLAI